LINASDISHVEKSTSLEAMCEVEVDSAEKMGCHSVRCMIELLSFFLSIIQISESVIAALVAGDQNLSKLTKLNCFP